jgi:hypothetical protein
MALLNDLSHVWGGDLSVAANGDLLLSSGSVLTEQRIVRRVMTNPAKPNMPADYIFETAYGMGLPSYVGSTASESEIAATTKGQVLMESSVAKSPPPSITAVMSDGTITETVVYTDSTTGQSGVLSIPTTPASQ